MAAKKVPVIDFSLCISCSICVQACGFNGIALTEKWKKGDNNLYPAVNGNCMGCGTCERSCPMSAIAMEEK